MVNTGKLLEELQDAGLPIDSINTNLDWTSTRTLNADEVILADQIIAAHDPTDLNEAIKPQIKNAVKNLAGVSIADMTTGQLKLLLFALAYKTGAIEPSDLTIRPVGKWIR